MALSVQFAGEEPLCGTIGQSALQRLKCCHPALEEAGEERGGIVFWPSWLRISRKSFGGSSTKVILACKNRCLHFTCSENLLGFSMILGAEGE